MIDLCTLMLVLCIWSVVSGQLSFDKALTTDYGQLTKNKVLSTKLQVGAILLQIVLFDSPGTLDYSPSQTKLVP